jgi:hypothetical protein
MYLILSTQLRVMVFNILAQTMQSHSQKPTNTYSVLNYSFKFHYLHHNDSLIPSFNLLYTNESSVSHPKFSHIVSSQLHYSKCYPHHRLCYNMLNILLRFSDEVSHFINKLWFTYMTGVMRTVIIPGSCIQLSWRQSNNMPVGFALCYHRTFFYICKQSLLSCHYDTVYSFI